MSLLGRLEDLSLTDIIQIVFLSRRTGILEIIDEQGRHTVLFRQGFIVNASSPASTDLGSYLRAAGLITDEILSVLKKTEDAGVPVGSAAVEMNVMTADALGEAIVRRITETVLPLLSSRDGEFNFILSETIGPLDLEYEPETIFKEGGIPPQKILGDGERLKPLKSLEETMKVGKALLRGSTPVATEAPPVPSSVAAVPPAAAETRYESPAAVDSTAADGDDDIFDTHADAGIDTSDSLESLLTERAEEEEEKAAEEDPAEEDQAEEAAEDEDSHEVPAPISFADEIPEDVPAVVETEDRTARTRDEAPRKPIISIPGVSGSEFRVTEDPKPTRDSRNAVIFERDPLVRVAARRAFSRKAIRTYQFGLMEDTRAAIAELLRENHFFVTFLELTQTDLEEEGDSIRLLQSIKRKNRHLPVVVIDREADLRRRHRLLREGADLYLTRPTDAHLQAGVADDELALFADELVLFAEKGFADWEELTGTFESSEDVGRQFYDIARKEKINRSFTLLKQFINELSNPNDIRQVTETILHLAVEYVDRAVVFVLEPEYFRGIAGRGATGGPKQLDTVGASLRLSMTGESILSQVTTSAEVHRGKLRRTAGNMELLKALGKINPTEVIVLPILHEETVVGLLYGDNAEHRAPIDDTSGLEIFLSQAGLAFGSAVYARRQRMKDSGETER